MQVQLVPQGQLLHFMVVVSFLDAPCGWRLF